MASNQETAVIKARMDRIPSALSPELVERIAADRASGYVNPYRCNDDQVIRRIDRAADKGTLMRPAFMRDTEKILHLPAYTRYAGKTQVFSFRSNDDPCHAAVCTCSLCLALRAISVAPWGSIAIRSRRLAWATTWDTRLSAMPASASLNDIYHERTGRYFSITCSRSACSTRCTAATCRSRRSTACYAI